VTRRTIVTLAAIKSERLDVDGVCLARPVYSLSIVVKLKGFERREAHLSTRLSCQTEDTRWTAAQSFPEIGRRLLFRQASEEAEIVMGFCLSPTGVPVEQVIERA
jgi:hypothetical protein